MLVSAHRCGGAADPAYDNTPAGVRYAASIGADYVEFDVRRTADGRLVCRHDPVDSATYAEVAAGGVVDLDDLLAAVAETGLGAHVDLKGTEAGDWALAVAERCAATLDLHRVVFTTGSATAAAALARWAETRADDEGPGPLVGLTVGGSTRTCGCRRRCGPGSVSSTRRVAGGPAARTCWSPTTCWPGCGCCAGPGVATSGCWCGRPTHRAWWPRRCGTRGSGC